MTVCFLGWNLPFCMDAEEPSQLYFFYLWSKHLQPRFGMSIYFPLIYCYNPSFKYSIWFCICLLNSQLLACYYVFLFVCIWLICLCLMLLFITTLLCLQSLRCFVLSEWWKHLYEYHAAGISLSLCLSLSVCSCMGVWRVCKPFYYDELWCWVQLDFAVSISALLGVPFPFGRFVPSLDLLLLYKLKNRIPG